MKCNRTIINYEIHIRIKGNNYYIEDDRDEKTEISKKE